MSYKTSILELIGNTPLLQLKGHNIMAKLEYFNPLGSVKDRAALYMLEGAETRGELTPGGTVIEATSGNTGIGLTYIACQKGYKAIMVMPENMSIERIKLLKYLGADVVLTPKSEGMSGTLKKAEEIKANTPNSIIASQFTNPDNVRSHAEGTAQEIITDLGDLMPDYLVLAFGSGGTITGLGKTLKVRYPNLKIIAVEPEESPLLSKGYAGPHKIQGIGANFIPEILDGNLIDEVRTVKSDTAIEYARLAATEYGTFVGISSGAALKAALEVESEHPDKLVITLFPDTGSRYLQ